jgi:hypothetical protein
LITLKIYLFENVETNKLATTDSGLQFVGCIVSTMPIGLILNNKKISKILNEIIVEILL